METESVHLQDVMREAQASTGWLKFLGIVNIVTGAIQVLTIIGILWAWIFIWMGVLLLQAGSSTQELSQLPTMLNKLKTYFIILSVITIISISFMILVFFLIVITGGIFREMFQDIYALG